MPLRRSMNAVTQGVIGAEAHEKDALLWRSRKVDNKLANLLTKCTKNKHWNTNARSWSGSMVCFAVGLHIIELEY